jgi:transposase
VTDRELDRNAARRLAIIRHAQEVTGNVAMTCRYYGVSRQVFYTWYRRYQTEGLAGLRDRSRRPLHCPHETSSEVVGKIIYLRQNYHFGPAKISMYLRRYHDVQVSNSGVWRILKRLELNRLRASLRAPADLEKGRYRLPSFIRAGRPLGHVGLNPRVWGSSLQNQARPSSGAKTRARARSDSAADSRLPSWPSLAA